MSGGISFPAQSVSAKIERAGRVLPTPVTGPDRATLERTKRMTAPAEYTRIPSGDTPEQTGNWRRIGSEAAKLVQKAQERASRKERAE